MSTSLTAENKNTVTLTPEAKDTGRTWEESNNTWEEEQGTWDNPGAVISKEDKNVVALTYETKN